MLNGVIVMPEISDYSDLP